jgi:thioredoxin-dependent peroxiredoxin
LRDNAEQFSQANCAIVGASFDTPAENLVFANAQGFHYPLLSDSDRSVGAAYGVVRSPGDQHSAFPKRHSFLVDPVGTLRRVYLVTDVATHASDVLADLEELQRV